VTSALVIMALQFLSFLVVTVNFRFLAKGNIGATVLTDALIAALGFTLFKLIAEANTPLEMVGYVLGASAGSAVGMCATRDRT
jgi:hypothetical protein